MSILTKDHKKQLGQWINKPNAVFKLLYKATRDGCSGPAFHQRCDNQGPTVSVAKNTSGYIYGGYTALSWTGQGDYKSDQSAFIFQVHPNMEKFQCTKYQSSVYDDNSYGPTFGQGHDVLFFSQQYNHNGNCFQTDGGTNVGYSYNMNGSSSLNTSFSHFASRTRGTPSRAGQNVQGRNAQWFTGNNPSNLCDIEVYAVQDGPVKPEGLLDDGKVWRKTDVGGWTEDVKAKLVHEISDFTPDESVSTRQARIMMCGPVGSGKSSFVNTIKSVWQGRVCMQVKSGPSTHSLTTKYRTYEIKPRRSQKPLNFRLCDMMGLEDGQGVNVIDIPYIIDGHLPDHFQFNPMVNISPKTVGFIRDPEFNDRIHCLVFVIDASTVNILPSAILQKMADIKKVADQRDLPVLILLTKIDKVCSEVEQDLSLVFRSQALQEKVMEVAEKIGVKPHQVVPVKNYDNETEVDTKVDILALLALRQMLRAAEDFFEEQIDLMSAENLAALNIKP